MKQRSRRIATWLAKLGCREFVVCAGARNAPLVLELYGLADGGEIKVWPFFEERSAGFFALGRIKATDRPVAVITTSGTATAELLPAIIESHYTNRPLIAVTADRPRRYRGCGAPQTIEQVGIYSHFVSHTVDFENDDELTLPKWDGRSPLHLNVCFEEPKASEMVREAWRVDLTEAAEYQVESASDQDVIYIEKFLERSVSPIILVGALERRAQEKVKGHLLRLGYPIYLESLSGLTGDQDLFPIRIWGGERCVAFGLERGWGDGVIRLGGTPTARVWRDLEGKFLDVPVLNLSEQTFAGLSRQDVKTIGLESLQYWPNRQSVGASLQPQWRELQITVAKRIDQLFLRFPKSEPALLASLAARLPDEARVYLGNSLPIREWESARGRRRQSWWTEGNRGANGIDGQISTFLGFADERSSNWAILGDLTTLYDLSAPWVIEQREFSDLNLVVVNNGGGRIFKRMYDRVELENEHTLNFSAWAKMWRLSYEAWHEIPADLGSGMRGRVIELQPDADETNEFWRAWEGLWRELSTP